jgi:hypothetical protein
MERRETRRLVPTVTAASARWAVVTTAWVVAVVVRGGVAQGPPSDPVRSTLAGVYSAAQAQGGQTIFETTCLGGCHNMSSHRGAAFKVHWDGKPLWDLYQLINETMPDDDPGSLTPSQSAQVVAYLLKLNGMPGGKDDLPTDQALLKKIRIEVPPGQRHGAGELNDTTHMENKR